MPVQCIIYSLKRGVLIGIGRLPIRQKYKKARIQRTKNRTILNMYGLRNTGYSCDHPVTVMTPVALHFAETDHQYFPLAGSWRR